MEGKQRDTNIDIYRAFAMIWVILVHTFYWTQSPTPAASYLLFEMPLFFFVAGAANALGSRKPVLTFWVSRFERLLIPYWVFAALGILLTLVKAFLESQPFLFSYVTWLLPTTVPQSHVRFLTWHLWFIPVYLLVMLVFPLLLQLEERFAGPVKFLPLVMFAVTLLAIDLDKMHNLAQRWWLPQVLFYSFWAYAGILYSRGVFRSWPKWRYALLGAVSAIATFLLVTKGGYPVDMQVNKFPPNLAFLLMNLSYFMLFVFLKEALVKMASLGPLKQLFQAYSKYGYTIYLYHPLAFLALSLVLKRVYRGPQPVAGLIYFVGVTLISTLFGRLLGPIEQVSTRFKSKAA